MRSLLRSALSKRDGTSAEVVASDGARETASSSTSDAERCDNACMHGEVGDQASHTAGAAEGAIGSAGRADERLEAEGGEWVGSLLSLECSKWFSSASWWTLSCNCCTCRRPSCVTICGDVASECGERDVSAGVLIWDR